MTRIKSQSTNKQVVVCWSYMEWKRVIYRWVTKGWNVTNDFLKGRGWEGQCWNFCLPTSDPPWFTFPHAFSYKNTWTAQNHGNVASKAKLEHSYLTLFSANLALHPEIILASGQTASARTLPVMGNSQHFFWHYWTHWHKILCFELNSASRYLALLILPCLCT